MGRVDATDHTTPEKQCTRTEGGPYGVPGARKERSMRTIVLAAAMSVFLVSLAQSASGDTLTMKDGTSVSGTLVGIVAQTITFKDQRGVVRRYNTRQVQTLEFDSVTQRSAADRSDGVTQGSAAVGTSGRSLEMLPTGTELAVRTVEEIDSTAGVANRIFPALVEYDVVGDSSNVIVPQGASVELVVRRISSGGATGSPEMMLDIKSITVGGRRYLVSTTDLKEGSATGIGKNKRTAEAVGGGAALGSILGAIAGGRKGAVIGVLAGAAGGAGVQVLTRGKDVRVPAETVLEFRLDKPVALRAEQ
ncbi:MAG: hypothetical protein DMF92_19390 [Acidobacteria bacterium]|nr:MAG: hypothetical protein DMF92_19390 [Acidobacteriota bacterium]